MAYSSGTATSYLDLLAKILDLALANGWTAVSVNGVASGDSTDLNLSPADSTIENICYLQSTGFSTTNKWQIEFFTYQNSSSGLYNIIFKTGVYNVAGDSTYLPNLEGNYQCLTNWNSSSNYWLKVNAGRVLCNTRIGSSYYLMYCGYFYPFASPSQYIAPLCSLGQGNNYTAVKYTDDIKSLSRTNTGSYSFTCITHEQSNANGHGNSSSSGVVPFRNESDLAVYSGSHPPLKVYSEDAYELFECIVVHSGAERGYLDGIRQISSIDNTNEAIINDANSTETFICFGQHNSLSNSQMLAIGRED